MIVRLEKHMVEEVVEIFKGLPHYFNPIGIKTLEEDLKAYFTKNPLAEEAGFFVYIEDNNILGMIGYKRLIYHREYEITWLAVKKDWQRKGIGRELFLYLENFLLQYKLEVFTVTIPDDPVPREFYYKMGFRSTTRFLDGKEERLVYQKRFGFIGDTCQEFVADYLRRKRLKEIKKRK